ncbi:MAG: hypothetical protein U0Z26_12685 [Anaerolineales bacterium]
MHKQFNLSQEVSSWRFTSGLVYLLVALGTIVTQIIWWQEFDFFQKIILYPLFILICLITATASFYNKCYERIVLDDNGVTYEALGIRIFIGWDKLSKVEKTGGILDSSEYISVRKHNINRKLIGWFLNYRNCIPISNFGKDWRDSNLGTFFKERAPNLFTQ